MKRTNKKESLSTDCQVKQWKVLNRSNFFEKYPFNILLIRKTNQFLRTNSLHIVNKFYRSSFRLVILFLPIPRISRKSITSTKAFPRIWWGRIVLRFPQNSILQILPVKYVYLQWCEEIEEMFSLKVFVCVKENPWKKVPQRNWKSIRDACICVLSQHTICGFFEIYRQIPTWLLWI